MRVLDDADVHALITPTLAVDAARHALLAAYQGQLVGPPRTRLDAGATQFVFTVGGLTGGPVGFRVYGLWPGKSDQLVAVWRADGHLDGVVTGTQLGAYRTGALGAVALDLLAAKPLESLAIIGTGPQAWTQLWASTAVRRPAVVRAFSRDPHRREAFARRGSDELGLDVRAVASAREAVEGAQSVILATTSSSPVVEAGWLAAASQISTVGPKFTNRTELPLDIIRGAALVACDSPDQMTSLGDPFWDATEVTHLGALVDDCGKVGSGGLRVFVSAGLAGSEVILAQRLLADDAQP